MKADGLVVIPAVGKMRGKGREMDSWRGRGWWCCGPEAAAAAAA